jgi:cell division protein FtsZ
MIEKTTPLVKAFSAVNKSLTESIQNLTEIIFRPALINIDFADLRTIFEGRGSLAYLNSIQIGDGEKEKEIEKIIYSPLYPYSIGGAKGILFNIAGQKDLPLTQVSQISKAISEKVDREAKIIFGISRMEKNQGTRVTILATGASPDSEEIPENKRRLKKKLPQPKEKPPISSKKKREEKDKSKKESPPKIAEEVIRKNGLQLKKEIEKEETEILMKEKSWEAPAFLRRKRTT